MRNKSLNIFICILAVSY